MTYMRHFERVKNVILLSKLFRSGAHLNFPSKLALKSRL
jgi:hypothetical protein